MSVPDYKEPRHFATKHLTIDNAFETPKIKELLAMNRKAPQTRKFLGYKKGIKPQAGIILTLSKPGIFTFFRPLITPYLARTLNFGRR